MAMKPDGTRWGGDFDEGLRGGGFVKRTVMEAYWCDVCGKGPFRAFVLIQIHMRGYHPGEGDS